MTRFFKVGDIVDVAKTEIKNLADAFVPGFPEQITSTTGRVTSTYRLRKDDNTGWVTVALSMCPEVHNLQFEAHHLELIIPTEAVSYINDLHSRIDALSHRVGALQDRIDTTEEKD